MEHEPLSDSPDKPGRRWREPGFLLPAAEALLIQVGAFILVYAFVLVFDRLLPFPISIGGGALLMAAAAALITWCRRLPFWWLPIQFCFPLAILLAYAMAFSPVVYFSLFMVFLLVYWTPFKTRVPLYLSGQPVWEKIATFIPENRDIQIADVGSGLGGLVLYLAKRFPKARITGIELAPFPWLIGWSRGRIARSRARFLFGDYEKIDFSQFDVVFIFLSPAVMPSLWAKASSDMRQGSLLLSYEFVIPHVKPDIVIPADVRGAKLYGWRIPGKNEDEWNI